ncbi:MAG: (2Fe-2S) ferredoxin domain-containing protein, partial [Armatimonadota bacterium]
MSRLATIDDLDDLRTSVAAEQERAAATIIVCGGPGCQASGCRDVVEALGEELRTQGFAEEVHLRVTGCHGFCEQGPLLVIEPGSIFYCQVTPADVPEIVARTIGRGETIERLLYTDSASGGKIRTEPEVPFYRLQDRTLLALHPRIDSSSITDYIAVGGYSA